MKNRLGLFLFIFTSCVSDLPIEFEFIKADVWKTFSNGIAEYFLSYPKELEIDHGWSVKDVLFPYDGYLLFFFDSTEGSKRGLWINHQSVDNIILSGIQGEK